MNRNGICDYIEYETIMFMSNYDKITNKWKRILTITSVKTDCKPVISPMKAIITRNEYHSLYMV